jgi:hypothetical protein
LVHGGSRGESKRVNPSKPVMQAVPFGAPQVHQLQVADFERLKSATQTIDRTMRHFSPRILASTAAKAGQVLV